MEKNYTKALEYAQKVIENTSGSNYSMLIQIYDHLVAIYAYLGSVEMVIKSQQDFRALMIKQSDLNLHRSLQEMEVKYETAQKELEIARQQTEINRQKTRHALLSAGLTVAGLLLVMLIYIVMLRTRRNRELANTNATKDKFFSIISHDLKNPAVAQRDAIQLLLDCSGQWDTASLSNYCRKLLQSANGQVDLLYTLLGWAQLQTGHMPFLPAQFEAKPRFPPVGTSNRFGCSM